MPPEPAPARSSAADRVGSARRVRRVTCIDAFRGLVMFLMLAEVLHLCEVAEALPDSAVWETLCHHQSHVAWRGWSVHDLIQPSFSLLVGVSLPFSLAARRKRGQSFLRMLLHAIWRSALLIILGIWLRSLGRSQTNFTFDDTLTQIGLGYTSLFLMGFFRPVTQWVWCMTILLACGVAFAMYPAPGPDFDWSAVGVPADWDHPEGLAAHWDKNSNAAWAFDRWWMNESPRDEPFTHHPGGYATLNFVPTLSTMILGLLAGGVLRSKRPRFRKLLLLISSGALLVAAGWLLDLFGVCPIVKRIWTPAWTLYSGGLAWWVLAFFYATTDLIGVRWWVYPLVVIGANSIVAYCSDWLFVDFIRANFATHLGPDYFTRFGPYEPLASGAAVLAVLWLILFWMYRKRIFVRI